MMFADKEAMFSLRREKKSCPESVNIKVNKGRIFFAALKEINYLIGA